MGPSAYLELGHRYSSVPPQPPPLYEEYREQERNFPQHNLSLPYPDGSHAKFLWAANHGSYFGWGNYMQEMILNAYLAYAAQRAYVFDNYTWDRDGQKSALGTVNPYLPEFRCPIIGGDMRDKDVPRAVSREYFFSVCPESERVVIDTQKIQNTLAADATVSQIVERWVTELNSIQSPCVELARNSPALFSYGITNTIRVLDVFPALSQSPILSDFGWSPLILEGFYNNLKLQQLSRAPRQILPPKPNGWKKNSEIARKHCLPSIPEIVEKVLAVTAPHITHVYIMTNAQRPWLAELRAALSAAHNWEDGIETSRDLQLSWEQKFVVQAVDMHVGQRADIFIGNGVISSLTSNVVLLRMHNPDLRPSDTHFW
ncbi:hypothetical protein B0H13DRAFT_2451325 [Mycena leptocephala]|nr:hypothetical protein B0H13DRAFT_2451325 [Mycena leptocephala]